ncbi:MAG: TrkA family potassium uptake protein [Candidatus Eremiobacteraeota bacterium]|nr:TrkA family potassium uptake protein [Candidatus Eremiobacteraeota bacterium]
MKVERKAICIVGLGKFGESLAVSMAPYCEVLAIDKDIDCVNALSETVQRALCIDARDHQALASVVSSDFDEAVVCIGERMESSILCTLHLKQLGIKTIRAKALSRDHAEILRSVGATHIIFPEKETAERLAVKILNPHSIDFIPFSEGYLAAEIAAPPAFHGKSLAGAEVRKKFRIFVIAVKKKGEQGCQFLPGAEHIIEQGDMLTIIGHEKDIGLLQAGAGGGEAPQGAP